MLTPSAQAGKEHDERFAQGVEQMKKEWDEAIKLGLVVARVSKFRCVVYTLTSATGSILRARKVYGPATREQCDNFCNDIATGRAKLPTD